MDRYLDTLAENELEIHKHVCIALEISGICVHINIGRFNQVINKMM
jgi:hypothetical protein